MSKMGPINDYEFAGSSSEEESISEHFTSSGDDSDDELPSPKRKKVRDSANADCKKIIDQEWVWKNQVNKPRIFEYTHLSGIRNEHMNLFTATNSIFDIFNMVFEEEFWTNIVTETNRCAEQTIREYDLRKIIASTWTPTNNNEIKVYLALCIIMAQVNKPKIEMNWSNRAIIDTPIFRNTMPYPRFSQITRFFNFMNDNTDNLVDKLAKIKSITKYFNDKFQELYVMDENITIDEFSMSIKGRLTYKQHNTSARGKYDIKFYKLCESATGYCYNFKIYSNKDKTNVRHCFAEAVVMELSKPILNKGHTLYLGNLYSSPQLYLDFVKNKTNVVGVVRANRANMPADFAKIRLKRGDCRIESCNGILALHWRDRNDVYIISSKHESIQMIEQHKKNRYPILKPQCVVDYNKGINGIECQDQILTCFPVMSKYLKGYRKMFFYMFDMALFNAYILYQKANATKKQNYTDYKLQIAEAILAEYPMEYSNKNTETNAEPSRLHAKSWGHFPKHIDPTPKKKHPTRTCLVCSKNKKRSETTWECKLCEVPLHLPECFEKYHTLHDY